MIPHLHQTVFLYYPYIYKSVFGRFLLLQLSKVLQLLVDCVVSKSCRTVGSCLTLCPEAEPLPIEADLIPSRHSYEPWTRLSADRGRR